MLPWKKQLCKNSICNQIPTQSVVFTRVLINLGKPSLICNVIIDSEYSGTFGLHDNVAQQKCSIAPSSHITNNIYTSTVTCLTLYLDVDLDELCDNCGIKVIHFFPFTLYFL